MPPKASERRLSHSGTIVFIVLLVARQLCTISRCRTRRPTPSLLVGELFPATRASCSTRRSPRRAQAGALRHFKRSAAVLQFNDAGAAQLRTVASSASSRPSSRDARQRGERVRPQRADRAAVAGEQRAPAVAPPRQHGGRVVGARLRRALGLGLLAVPPGMRGGSSISTPRHPTTRRAATATRPTRLCARRRARPSTSAATRPQKPLVVVRRRRGRRGGLRRGGGHARLARPRAVPAAESVAARDRIR